MKQIVFHLIKGYVRRVTISRFVDAAARLPDGNYDLIIRDRREKRTLPQNAILHAIINDVANETGNDPRKLKEDFKKTLGLTEVIVGADGKEREIPKPTEDYTPEEMSAFLTRIIALCEEHDLFVGHHLEDDRP
jgi:hypothetical protein